MRGVSRPGILAAVLVAGCTAGPDEPDTAGPGFAWTSNRAVRAPTAASGEQSGYALALSGDATTLAVGAPMNASASSGVQADDSDAGEASSFGSGAVRVYASTDAGWSLESFIQASNAGLNDQFGSTLAISGDGDTLAVSAVFEDGGGAGVNPGRDDDAIAQSGAVYLFERRAGAWSETAYVKASNAGEPGDGDTFGYAISLSGDGNTLAVGAPSEDSASAVIDGDAADNASEASGAVYVFERNGGDWSQQAYVKSSGNAPGALFGYAVALDADGDRLAASAYDEDGGRGAVYLFARNGGAWSEEARLQPSNVETQDSIGVWIDISDDGERVAAGSPDEDSLLRGVVPAGEAANDEASNTSAGAVHVFAMDDGAWTQEAFIKASNTGLEDWFGYRLALDGEGATLAIAAPNEDSAADGLEVNADDDSAPEAGAVYVYRRDGREWSHEAFVKSPDGEQFDEFGSAVALSNDGRMLVVGARFDDGAGEDAVADSGAAHVFEREARR